MTSLPTTLLLDLDDTILDDTGQRDHCWEVACAELAQRDARVDADVLMAALREVRDRFWADPEDHRVWRAQMLEAWREIGRRALARIGVDDPAAGAALGDRNFAMRDELRSLLPGALDTLEELRRRGVTLGLITNGASTAQREKLERFALSAHFAYIGIEGEVGHGKPEPESYAAALDALRADPADTWMVGDNLEWDVAGAQAAGITGIWLDRDGSGLPPTTTVRPDRVVRSIAELVGQEI